MTSRRKTVGLAAFAALAVALASSLYGAAVTSAAGNRVETTLRRTVNCTMQEAALQISAFASNPSIGSANVTISTGNPTAATGLLGISNKQKQYGLGSACHSVTKKVVMSRHGLISAGASHTGDIRYPTAYCASPGHVLMRFVLGLDASGTPVSAKVEITQPHARLKPLGQVQWSPDKSVTYYRPGACTIQQQ